MHRGKEAIRAYLRGYGYDMDDYAIETMRDAIELVLSREKPNQEPVTFSALSKAMITSNTPDTTSA